MPANSFTVLWTSDYCRRLKKAGDVGRALRVLFGGEHQSQPSLTRYGVAPGDFVYPIRVEKGILYLISRMRVTSFVELPEYVATLPVPSDYAQMNVWHLTERLWNEHPDWGHLIPWGCLLEVALGSNGFPIRFDRAVPPSVVESLRFVSKRAERPIKHVEDGRIKSSVSLQGGVYRLSPPSAEALERVLNESAS